MLKTIETATLRAAQVPLTVAQKSVSVMALAERAVALGNLNAISDGASASSMAHAALTLRRIQRAHQPGGTGRQNRRGNSPQPITYSRRKGCKLEKNVQKSIQERGRFLTGMKSATVLVFFLMAASLILAACGNSATAVRHLHLPSTQLPITTSFLLLITTQAHPRPPAPPLLIPCDPSVADLLHRRMLILSSNLPSLRREPTRSTASIHMAAPKVELVIRTMAWSSTTHPGLPSSPRRMGVVYYAGDDTTRKFSSLVRFLRKYCRSRTRHFW